MRLRADAWAVFQSLDQHLSSALPKGTTAIVTSTHREHGVPGPHTNGRAIDFVVHGVDMPQLAEWLRAQGYRAQFEKKGQKNANGSVATGDHIHVTLV
jgi:hypothetical protein